MLYRNVSLVFTFACAIGAAGCRDNGTLTPADLSMGGGGTGGTGGGGGSAGDMAVVMKNYMPSTIAAMRQMPAGQADIELDNVIAIALTPSTKSPRLFMQDAGGGDYSAVEADCSSGSMSHPCTVASTVHTTVLGDKVTVKGTYSKSGMAKGSYEVFYIDSITDNGAGTAPMPLALTEADIERATDATVTGFAKNFFQKVTVTPSVAINMYDWTPSELKYSGTWPGCTTAPFVFGFGMIPSSVTGATATGACTTKTAQPAGQTTPDMHEILIGTDFYKDFTVSSDCQCTTGTAMNMPGMNTTWAATKPITGILIYNVPFGGTVGYKQFSPTQMPDSTTLTNLVAPPPN